jgi:UDP-3-O-[3-hydroxymyristoyl] glucosamine N-acyltransferase
MVFTAAQIALLVQGTVEGDDLAAVSSFGKIEDAGPGQLSFLANPKYEDYLYTTGASVVIVNDSLQLRQPLQSTLIRVPNAYTAFATLLTTYQEMQAQQWQGIQQPSYIDPTAKVGDKVFIGAFAYIGKGAVVGDGAHIHPHAYVGDGAVVGTGSRLMPGVKLYHHCVVGNRVTIHAGTVIGADGFGFAPQADGSYKKVPQIGNVIIEDNVEIGANTCIDRATIGSTIIRKGAKVDNLVQLAHNVEVGENTVVAAQVGISGSTKLGAQVMVGGQAGIVGHIHIGDGARINAQSGVSKSLAPGKAVTGSPAYDYTSALRSQAVQRRLPDLEKRIKELEALVAELKKS